MIKPRLISLALATVMVATGAQALTPPLPCDVKEGGMKVYGAMPFGHDASGFVIESYYSLKSDDGILGGADGPVEALNQFVGLRVTDCRSGKFVAIKNVAAHNGFEPMLATEFLRPRNQSQKPFRFGDVRRAAMALYGKDDFTPVTVLRETEQTCGCDVLFPGMWK